MAHIALFAQAPDVGKAVDNTDTIVIGLRWMTASGAVLEAATTKPTSSGGRFLVSCSGGYMARTKLARRFEPRGGISQSMLDSECKFVARELDDYLLYSIVDLREKLAEIQRKIATAEEEVQAKLSSLPDRERLAIRCMLARDIYHIAMLYSTFIATSTVAEATGTIGLVPEEIDQDTDEPKPALPFCEWLFGS